MGHFPRLLCEGDDEQSDWFFEGDCGVGTGVAGLLPSWDSDSQLPLEDNHPSATFLQPTRLSDRGCRDIIFRADIASASNAKFFLYSCFCRTAGDKVCSVLFRAVAGYHSRLKRLAGSASCCVRRDRRRPPTKVKESLDFTSY